MNFQDNHFKNQWMYKIKIIICIVFKPLKMQQHHRTAACVCTVQKLKKIK